MKDSTVFFSSYSSFLWYSFLDDVFFTVSFECRSLNDLADTFTPVFSDRWDRIGQINRIGEPWVGRYQWPVTRSGNGNECWKELKSCVTENLFTAFY